MSDPKSLGDQLDEVLELHRKWIERRIDASACGTGYDFRRMHDAEEKYHDAKGEFSDRLEKVEETMEALRARVAHAKAFLAEVSK